VSARFRSYSHHDANHNRLRRSSAREHIGYTCVYRARGDVVGRSIALDEHVSHETAGAFAITIAAQGAKARNPSTELAPHLDEASTRQEQHSFGAQRGAP
jgi:hypothetical protein